MTERTAKTLKAGDVVRCTLTGDSQIVDRIEGIFIILKWIREDGTLSKGEDWNAPCHLKYHEIIQRA